MKDKFFRVLLHTVEFLVVIGASALVVKLAPAIGLGALSAEAIGIVSAGMLAALAKLIREIKTDYVNLGK
jgi:hypothetical protein